MAKLLVNLVGTMQDLIIWDVCISIQRAMGAKFNIFQICFKLVVVHNTFLGSSLIREVQNSIWGDRIREVRNQFLTYAYVKNCSRK